MNFIKVTDRKSGANSETIINIDEILRIEKVSSSREELFRIYFTDSSYMVLGRADADSIFDKINISL